MDASDGRKMNPEQQSIKDQQTNSPHLQNLNQLNHQQVFPMESNPANQAYIFQPQYQPIIVSQNQQINIVKNQNLPSITPITFHTVYPKIIDCPYCNKEIKTEVEESFSVCSCIYCCFLIIFFPVGICYYICTIIENLRDIIDIICCCHCHKCDCNSCDDCCNDCKCDCKCCIDGTHYCPICRRELGNYSSCRHL